VVRQYGGAGDELWEGCRDCREEVRVLWRSVFFRFSNGWCDRGVQG